MSRKEQAEKSTLRDTDKGVRGRKRDVGYTVIPFLQASPCA